MTTGRDCTTRKGSPTYVPSAEFYPRINLNYDRDEMVPDSFYAFIKLTYPVKSHYN